MEGTYEPVHVFAESDDGPRSGLADFRGRPHLYQSLYRDWDRPDEPGQDHFALVPVPDAEVTALLARLRCLGVDPEVVMVTQSDVPLEHTPAFWAAWNDLRCLAVAGTDQAVLAACEMRVRNGRSLVPFEEEGPLEARWAVVPPDWMSGPALRERWAELERRV